MKSLLPRILGLILSCFVTASLLGCSTQSPPIAECDGGPCPDQTSSQDPSKSCKDTNSRYGSTTIATTGRPCNNNCDCNNQAYEGICKKDDSTGKGTCISFKREECTEGEIETCTIRDALQRRTCSKDGTLCGECKTGTRTCQDEGLKRLVWGDCIPNPTEEKGATKCVDAIDNDCDGQIDENDTEFCQCRSGSTRNCYPSRDSNNNKIPSTTKNVGICKTGTQKCIGAVWEDKCEGAILPGKETCNGIDDDCNGLIDDNLETKAPSCKLQQGVCAGTKQRCGGDAGWLPCNAIDYGPNHQPQQEKLCDGKDNDCDGNVDEDFEKLGTPCTVGTGVCQAKGKYQCASNGFILECNVKPAISKQKLEECNGKDDDCNGLVDDGVGFRPCYDKNKKGCTQNSQGSWSCIGSCKTGLQTCENGKWGGTNGACSQLRPILPIKETCNRLDDDCDGEVDEEACGVCRKGQTVACYPTNTIGCSYTNQWDCKGECRTGTKTCQDDLKWGPCINFRTKSTDTCDGKDNDCDGSIDNQEGTSVSLTKPCYTGPTGTQGKGLCKGGTSTCNKGRWSICTGEVTPSSKERCDGQDDNCNGAIDEGCPCNYLKINTGVCIGQTRDFQGSCQKPLAYEATETLCDGKDNNCNGVVDEGCPCNYLGKASGVCAQQKIALNGQCTTPTTYEANETLCDGKDNDCDGKVDNGLKAPLCKPTTNQGACKGLTKTCGGVQGWLPCNNIPNYEIKETLCDNIDNDCDGLVDESQGCVITMAGSGSPLVTNHPTNPLLASFNTIAGMVYTTENQDRILYVSNSEGGVLQKINLTQGEVKTIAGDGTRGKAIDAVGTKARFNLPKGLALDNKGNLYICDSANGRIRSMNVSSGAVRTVAGNGNLGTRDGTGTTATFYSPDSMVWDKDANVLYIADGKSNTIRKISNPNNVNAAYVSTIAGQCCQGSSCSTTSTTCKGAFKDASKGTDARFNGPSGLLLQYDPKTQKAVALYVADSSNHRIRKIDLTNPSYPVTTAAGVGAEGSTEDTPLKAKLRSPRSLVWYSSKQEQILFVGLNNRVRRLRLVQDSSCTSNCPNSLKPYVHTFAGGGAGYPQDKTGLDASFSFPTLIVPGTTNIWYISDLLGNRIRQIDATAKVTTVAGKGAPGFADGHATNQTILSKPSAMDWNSKDSLFFVDLSNFRVRQLSLNRPSPSVKTIAGNGTFALYQPGDRSITFKSLHGLAWNTKDSVIYLSEEKHIRRLSKNTNQPSQWKLDTAVPTSTTLNTPKALAWNSTNNRLYIVSHDSTKPPHYRILEWDPTNKTLKVLAGSTRGDADEVGVNAKFGAIVDLTWNGKDYLYVSDLGDPNNAKGATIRRITIATGKVETLTKPGDIPKPSYLAVLNGKFDGTNTEQRLYIVDTSTSAENIRFITNPNGTIPSGKFTSKDLVKTIPGYKDGRIGKALFYDISHLFAADKYLYISEHRNHRIRRIQVLP